jgi:hypothetical protein
MPKLPKCARSLSPDHNLLSESEMLIEDLDIHGDKIFDANAQAAANDERTAFYLEQLEKELSGSFWVLDEEANELYGVRKIMHHSEL